jgi:molybdopterin/thiamine biosynthesis adenylyltransferase
MPTPWWYRKRNDRSLRYADRVLPTDRPIVLRMGPAAAARYDGQVAAIVAANLLARMTPAVAFDVPDAEIQPPLPWAGTTLRKHLTTTSFAADPSGLFEMREPRDGDYVLSLGRHHSAATVHGSGWNAFVGPGASPLPDSDRVNPIGPALAVIIAVARLFALQMEAMDGPHLVNAFNWQSSIIPEGEAPPFHPALDLGTIWAVGLGSVGTAVLYFLTLLTNRLSAALFDMDFVKIHNLDRSPIFTASDAENRVWKVDATQSYLRSVGVRRTMKEQKALDESSLWFDREAGTPDLLISAANERNVRYIIEQSAPPLQIYGTTGANWEASVIRHIPLVDACSCCLFPPGAPQSATACATETAFQSATGETIDASLPFLSFAVGLMSAAEVLKADLPGYPFSPNRTTLYTHPAASPRFVSPTMARRPGCLCADRSSSVHRRMIEHSKYAFLSAPVHPPAQ